MFKIALMTTLVILNQMAHAALPNDAIQRCLDVRRLVDITSREKMAAVEPGVFRFKFHKISAHELPLSNANGNMDEILHALNKQIENCKKNPTEFKTVTIAGHTVNRDTWCLETNQKMLAIAKASHGDFKQYYSKIKTEFDWYKSEGWPENHAGFKKGAFQFTAYYAPAALLASSKRGGEYRYPVYSNPNVVNVVAESKKFNLKAPLCGIDPVSKMVRGYCIKNADGTYAIAPDRDEIEHGAISPKYIIAYLKDPNDAAFLMLQGSGSLLIDGKLYRLNYAGANGRPRTMLGRIVQCAQDPTCGGNIDAMARCAKNPKCHDEEKLKCNVSPKIKQSAGTEKLIRQYLDSPLNREKAFNLRNRDQSFIFFAKDTEGPYGSEHIALTPHVSCATDHSVIPVGMNFIYQVKNESSWCVAQDSGGAIIGAHVDIYKGAGKQAGMEANAINHSGSLYVALPKTAT